VVGTGLVGEELKELGFSNIDGSDMSGEILRKAEAKVMYFFNPLQGKCVLKFPNPSFVPVVGIIDFNQCYNNSEA
jgi:hypothetical protein